MRAEGPRGAFALDVPGGKDDALRLEWGAAGGPILAVWAAPGPGTWVAGWQGAVGVGGFVERLHVLEAHDLELVIAEVVGGLLPPGYQRVPTLADMRQAPFTRTTEDSQPLSPECTYTFLAMAESIHAEYLHHAMVSELAVDCFAALGPQAGGWHAVVGLPLLLESVSLLAPGARG
ncbi:MAG: hypothetical protein JXN59_11395 [Anaerolineae bacterium]|nr:hypothetical protein [Anaerolineae bacterium]